MHKMIELNTLLYLSLSLVAALIAGKIVKKLHLPNVTGYLVIGLAIGPYGLGLLSMDTVNTFSILSEIALGFIAFSIGSEFQLKFLRKIGKAPVVIGIFEALCATIFVDIVLLISGYGVTLSLCIGAIASATAAASTLMVVKQYKAKGPVTNILLPVVAIDDAVALMAFGLSTAVAKALSTHGGSSLFKALVSPLAEIFLSLLLGMALGILFSFVVKYYTGRGNRLAATIAFVLFCTGICDLLDLSALLAVMALSAVFANISAHQEKIFEPVERMTPPLYMLFFIISGASLNISILPSVGVLGLIYVVFRILGKMFGSYLGSRISGTPKTVQRYLGLTLIPQEGVAIGLATIAMSIDPTHGETIKTVVLCGIVVFELLGPMITKFALKRAGEIG